MNHDDPVTRRDFLAASSIALGVGHAVAPGHGKTVIAAYLVGQRGTRRQAVWLGATVTATHTAGVLLLGLVLSLTDVASPERFLPATEVASGLLLAGVGIFLLRRALRARAASRAGSRCARRRQRLPDRIRLIWVVRRVPEVPGISGCFEPPFRCVAPKSNDRF